MGQGNLSELKEDFQALLKHPGWGRLVKAVEDARNTVDSAGKAPLVTAEDIAGANFTNGVVKGLTMFLDFPAQQIAAAEMKLRKKQENDDGE